ncbi:MAG: N,N-dimethylformamidase beta subunit family domain-containing protein [Bacillota bacterium]
MKPTFRCPLITLITFIFCCSNTIFPQISTWKPAFNENGYVNPCSLTKGDTVKFHISTTRDPFTILIYKLGVTEKIVKTIDNVKGGHRTTPFMSWEKGCGWPVSYSMVIPDNWESGAYAARFPVDTGAGMSTVLFFVKEKNPGSVADILVIMPYFNWVAYNTYGGKNVYDENSTEGKRAYKVSFNRPLFGGGYAEFRSYPYKMLKWLESNNMKYEVATEFDLHKIPGLLNNYKLAMIVGHAEYWTRDQWNNTEKYIRNGGKFMSLSGNTCWWQVRIEDNDNTLVCYKDRRADPLYGVIDSLVTVNWIDKPLNRPENLLFGASFRNAGYVDDINHKDFTHAQGYGGYSAHNTQNWIFNNTGLKDGDLYGRDPKDSLSSIVGYEVDGALHKWINGLPEVIGTDGTPKNFRIIGMSPSIGQGDTIKDRYATAGIYYTKKGGAMFNSSTIYWVYGLPKDVIVQTITMNVIKKFLSNRFPPEITGWNPFVLETDTVNHEIIQVSRRTVEVKAIDTVKFSLKTEDPYGDPIKYIWYVDSAKVSTDSVFRFKAAKEDWCKVTAYVYNSKDTASIYWMVNATGPVSTANERRPAFRYNLEQNYPNPFNPSTNIKYSLAHESHVKITIYNAIGQVAAVLADKVQSAGNFNIVWESGSAASGIYFYAIDAVSTGGSENFRAVKKMILLR